MIALVGGEIHITPPDYVDNKWFQHHYVNAGMLEMVPRFKNQLIMMGFNKYKDENARGYEDWIAGEVWSEPAPKINPNSKEGIDV